MRALDRDQSEMITQLLFGEKVEVILKKHTNWAKIRSLHDNYVGWVDKRMIYYLRDKEFEKLKKDVVIVAEFAQGIASPKESHCISFGAELPRFDGISSKLPFGKFIYNGQFIKPEQVVDKREMVIKLANKFLFSPYLWGGRSPFGLDCSGFVQVVYKMVGIQLPRDAKDQIYEGDVIDFISQVKPGDLAFFSKEGRVHHVGIILDNQRVIHASGFVRIDKLDHFGIYNKEERRYSHELRLCKSIL